MIIKNHALSIFFNEALIIKIPGHKHITISRITGQVFSEMFHWFPFSSAAAVKYGWESASLADILLRGS